MNALIKLDKEYKAALAKKALPLSNKLKAIFEEPAPIPEIRDLLM